MRDIKFRGMKKDGTFAYGSLVITDAFVKHMPKQHSKTWIVTSAFGNGGWFHLRGRVWVDQETVGQFTGLKCDKGVEIYEGDIVHCYDLENDGFLSQSISGVVEFHGGSFCVKCDKGYYNTLAMTCASSVDLVGNIHESPELLNK